MAATAASHSFSTHSSAWGVSRPPVCSTKTSMSRPQRARPSSRSVKFMAGGKVPDCRRHCMAHLPPVHNSRVALQLHHVAIPATADPGTDVCEEIGGVAVNADGGLQVALAPAAAAQADEGNAHVDIEDDSDKTPRSQARDPLVRG